MLEKFNNIIKEILLTFSNKKSIISSKRIERCIAFILTCILIPIFVWHNRNNLTATDFTIVLSPLFLYMGFTTTQIKSYKKEEKKDEIS